MIEATIKHALPAEYPRDLPLFLDLDLEVLGVSSPTRTMGFNLTRSSQRPRELYIAYASQIRREYSHYPEEAYCRGRTAVLQHLKEGSVYFTEHWRHRLAANAQANLDWEIGELTNGSIPGAS
jgi:predicted metal-dependent HD superfamily phosphohydrolase